MAQTFALALIRFLPNVHACVDRRGVSRSKLSGCWRNRASRPARPMRLSARQTSRRDTPCTPSPWFRKRGGSGKSMLAIGLAIAAMQDGHKVCLLETDPQGTVSNWRRRRTQSEPMVENVIAGFEIEQKLPFLENSGAHRRITSLRASGTANAVRRNARMTALSRGASAAPKFLLDASFQAASGLNFTTVSKRWSQLSQRQ